MNLLHTFFARRWIFQLQTDGISKVNTFSGVSIQQFWDFVSWVGTKNCIYI